MNVGYVVSEMGGWGNASIVVIAIYSGERLALWGSCFFFVQNVTPMNGKEIHLPYFTGNLIVQNYL